MMVLMMDRRGKRYIWNILLYREWCHVFKYDMLEGMLSSAQWTFDMVKSDEFDEKSWYEKQKYKEEYFLF